MHMHSRLFRPRLKPEASERGCIPKIVGSSSPNPLKTWFFRNPNPYLLGVFEVSEASDLNCFNSSATSIIGMQSCTSGTNFQPLPRANGHFSAP